jgi:hypothetical protein
VILVFTSICTSIADTGKILGNTGNTSIANTGRFWKILVIPVLQILENTGYTSIADIGRLGRIPVNPSFQYSYFGNDQYFLVLQILENSGRYWNTSIYQYLYQYCRYWKILVKFCFKRIWLYITCSCLRFYFLTY